MQCLGTASVFKKSYIFNGNYIVVESRLDTVSYCLWRYFVKLYKRIMNIRATWICYFVLIVWIWCQYVSHFSGIFI